VRLKRLLLLLLQWLSLMVGLRLLLVWRMQLLGGIVASVVLEVLSEHGVVRRALHFWSRLCVARAAEDFRRGDAL
jgi:hypothetical protein